MLSAWAGGLGPGLLTTILGAIAVQYFLLAPLSSFALPSLADSLGLLLFVGVGTIISVLNQSLRTARAESLDHVEQLTSAMTERLRTEQALRESRERLQLALDAASEGLWDLNVVTGEAYYSPQYYRMLGYEVNEWPATYQMWLSLLHPEDRLEVDTARTEQIRRQAGRFDLEYRLRKKGGEYAWVRSRGRAVSLADDGSPTRLIGTLLDITDAKRLEEQFRQAQRLDSIGQLAGGVAHDFNNLLTVINGYAAMAEEELPPDSPVINHLHEIRSAGERGAQLTNQLLAFGRKQLLRPVVVNLNQVVDGLSKMLQRLIGENISLVSKLAADLRNVKADPSQLQQVIMNLAINSRDAMPGGGTLIIETANVHWDEAYVSKHPQVQPGPHVMLAVTDNGVGMTPETQERLFEPFFTTKPAGRGTGLGLSTVYGIIRQSGGRIWVYSEPGRGSTFKIYFPCSDEPVADAAPLPQIDLRGQETILVVEDQEEVRTLAVMVLSKFGYTVFSAGGPEEALTFCQSYAGRLDLLLTDVIMPVMSGRQLVERLKVLLPNLQVLYMSGYTDNAIAHHGVLEDNVAYLQKPFTAEQLAEKVRRVLGPSGR